MRLAIVQTNATLGAVDTNIARATTLLEQLPPSQLDLIILPELAFSGYNFQSPKQITPFVETRTKSPSRTWAQETARRYNCSVLIGLPTQDTSRHNTAALVDRSGTLVHEYYKHHMFDTDYNWGCTPGPGFSYTSLSFGNNNDTNAVRTSVGICMDLNPWEFKAPFSSYEYANYILENDISLVLLPMAWLLPSEYDPQTTYGPSKSTMEYWIRRLDPLIHDSTIRTIVICNRTGEEEGAAYAGTSCVLRIGTGKVVVLGLRGREEGVLIVDVDF